MSIDHEEAAQVRSVRTALIIAASLVSTACGAQERRTEPADLGERSTVAPSFEDRSRPQVTAARNRPSMTQQYLIISSDWGQVTAELVDNDAARGLVGLLPATIQMRDHLRQEKTGNLPSPLPEAPRQTAFAAGTLGLWGNDDFVIYYRSGHVPEPGIVVLGRVTGDVSIFDRPGTVTVQLKPAN